MITSFIFWLVTLQFKQNEFHLPTVAAYRSLANWFRRLLWSSSKLLANCLNWIIILLADQLLSKSSFLNRLLVSDFVVEPQGYYLWYSCLARTCKTEVEVMSHSDYFIGIDVCGWPCMFLCSIVITETGWLVLFSRQRRPSYTLLNMVARHDAYRKVISILIITSCCPSKQPIDDSATDSESALRRRHSRQTRGPIQSLSAQLYSKAYV